MTRRRGPWLAPMTQSTWVCPNGGIHLHGNACTCTPRKA